MTCWTNWPHGTNGHTATIHEPTMKTAKLLSWRLQFYSNITLLQKPNCKKYIAVQNVCIVTSSSCKTYELWHENFINTLLNWKPSKDFYEVFITKHFWPELYIFIIILNERLRFKESLVMENRTIKTTYLE